MISEKDKLAILDVAKRYRVSRILLFGSSAGPSSEGSDIDLAVEGIHPGDFFQFYGDLIFSVSKPLDLIDLSSKSKFTQIVRREGIVLYDGSE